MNEQQQRKKRSEQILTEKGIAVNEWLPCAETEEECSLRSLDAVCRRAVAALISVQVAFELSAEDIDPENVRFCIELFDKFGVKDCLNRTESAVVGFGESVLSSEEADVPEQEIVNVVWEYECYWALVWALGLVDDITEADDICDCQTAVDLVSSCESLDEFKAKCSLRSKGEILDMLDLYYRYHWAVVEKRLRPDTETGDLNGEVVYERRRGLEWLTSDENDWHDISLDT
ncbi:MAG: DUF4272 domain-containing protein [Ruminococcus sp.]|nr:DUF4272 domain-containing protein [Ruminococcus sp.]